MNENFDKKEIIDMIQPLSDCIYEDNQIIRTEILSRLMKIKNKVDKDVIYELLIAEVGEDGTAEAFFDGNLDNRHILEILIDTALYSESGDARMESAYRISKYSVQLLRAYEKKLLILQTNEWGSVSDHILVALGRIKSREGLKYLIKNKIGSQLYWEAEALKYYLEDILKD